MTSVDQTPVTTMGLVQSSPPEASRINVIVEFASAAVVS